MGTDIDVLDLHRMFLGEESPWFLVEVAFRTTFMFVYTLILVRATGKRGLGELSPFELLLVVALGSAVGDPMLYADVPLLHAMAVVTVIVLLQRAVAIAVDHSSPLERFVESTPTRLVHRGVIDLDAMRAEHFSRDELFMLLREEGVEQLGQVKRAYLEPSGRVSVWLLPKEDAVPGLPLLPSDDPDCPEPILAGAALATVGALACVACGFVRELSAEQRLRGCEECGTEGGWLPVSDEAGVGNQGSGGRRRRRGPFSR